MHHQHRIRLTAIAAAILAAATTHAQTIEPHFTRNSDCAATINNELDHATKIIRVAAYAI